MPSGVCENIAFMSKTILFLEKLVVEPNATIKFQSPDIAKGSSHCTVYFRIPCHH